jgi:ornithine carbamoyltransferase
MRHFIEITDFTTEELSNILDRADELQKCWQTNSMPQSLVGQKIALWFFGNGFRNRVAFEIGARAMGADVCFIPGELGVQEPLEDVGHYLKNWFSMLVIRAKSHEALTSVASQVDIPLINARTNHNHPCEILGDLQFIRQRRSSLEELHVVFVGEVTNLCMSWFEAAVRLPISILQVAPPGYELDADSLARLNANARGRIEISHDLADSVRPDTDVIYTDTWPTIGEPAEIKAAFLPYQINTSLLDQMNQDGFFLPCPPVTRGQEVSVEAMNSPLCLNYQAKGFLLHMQNAIMEFLVTAVPHYPLT